MDSDFCRLFACIDWIFLSSQNSSKTLNLFLQQSYHYLIRCKADCRQHTEHPKGFRYFFNSNDVLKN